MESKNLLLKQCTQCLEVKGTSEYYKHIKSKDGLRTYCKGCSKKYNTENRDHLRETERSYWEARPEQYKEKTKRARSKDSAKEKRKKYLSNPEVQKAQKEKVTQWREKNKEIIRLKKLEYRRNNLEKVRDSEKRHRENNLNARLAKGLRSRIRDAIKFNKKPGSAVKDLGCTLEQLKNHLESKFKEGMNWDNWSLHGWHIDHVIPLSSFDLSNKDQFLKACHYTNLQPLWASENLSKGNKKDV